MRFGVELCAPTVASFPAANITTSSATLNGEVTSDSGAPITERGFYWKPGTGVTTADTKVVVAGSTGPFEADLTSLAYSNQYSYKAYATSAGRHDSVKRGDLYYSDSTLHAYLQWKR